MSNKTGVRTMATNLRKHWRLLPAIVRGDTVIYGACIKGTVWMPLSSRIHVINTRVGGAAGSEDSFAGGPAAAHQPEADR